MTLPNRTIFRIVEALSRIEGLGVRRVGSNIRPGPNKIIRRNAVNGIRKQTPRAF
jgi:hypothetical protein